MKNRTKVRLFETPVKPLGRNKCVCYFCNKGIGNNDMTVVLDDKKMHTECVQVIRVYTRLHNHIEKIKSKGNTESSSYSLWLLGWHRYLTEYLVDKCASDKLLKEFNIVPLDYSKIRSRNKRFITDIVTYNYNNIPALIAELDKLGA